MNTLLSVLTTLALVYIGFGLLLFFTQRSILYYPTPVIAHGFEEEIFSDEVDVRVIVLNSGSDKAVLYFGGNADSMALNAPQLSPALAEFTVYLVNYRSYGGSGGTPTEAGLYRDALFIYDEVSQRHTTIDIIGRSLGSGVATYVSANRNVGRLVLVTPIDSIVSVAGGHYPVYPASLMVLDRYDSIGRADRIHAETLVLIAENDRIIPPRHSERLANALSHVLSSVQVLDSVDHNTISIHPNYYSLISEFLASESKNNN